MATRDMWMKVTSYVSVIAIAAALTGIVSAISHFFDLRDLEVQRSVASEAFLVAELEKRLEQEISQLRSEVATAVSEIIEDTEISDEAEIGLRFQRIDSQLASIENQLSVVSTIETAIVENPQRAMSLPILRRDVDAIEANVAQDLSAIRLELDRVYDLGKWFLGLIATMALGVLGLAVGNLFKGKE